MRLWSLHPKYLDTKVIKLEEAIEQAFKARWETENEKAVGIIGQHVAPSFYPLISETNSAFKIWNNLAKHFEGTNKVNKLTLKNEFYSTHQQPNESLLIYLDRLILISQKLSDLGNKTPEEEICYKAISSLNIEYKPIQMAVLMMDEKDLNINYLRQQFALETNNNNNNQQKQNKPNGVQVNTVASLICDPTLV